VGISQADTRARYNSATAPRKLVFTGLSEKGKCEKEKEGREKKGWIINKCDRGP
jgi:hypothetical protein